MVDVVVVVECLSSPLSSSLPLARLLSGDPWMSEMVCMGMNV